MAENYILPWAQTSTANALSDADYASDMATNGSYVDGVKSGQASSQQANKTWRQGTSVAAGLAQFIVDNLSLDVTDGDTPNTFSERISNAILSLSQISNFNQSFSSAVGGYKKYSIVSDSSGNYWISEADNNTTIPGSTDGKWSLLRQPGQKTILTFTQSQNWTVPIGVTSIFAKIWGAGGAGGLGVNNGCGSGGNGGQYIEVSIPVTPGALIWVAVGAGGEASTTSGTPGASGADSSVSGISARGGTYGGEGNGTTGNTTSNPPTTAVANGFALAGFGGTNGILMHTVDVDTYQAGTGGGSPSGGGYAFSGVSGVDAVVNGSNGVFPGGGGGGGINSPGGSGANGFVIIEY